jgi:hypothetical protein
MSKMCVSVANEEKYVRSHNMCVCAGVCVCTRVACVYGCSGKINTLMYLAFMYHGTHAIRSVHVSRHYFHFGS